MKIALLQKLGKVILSTNVQVSWFSRNSSRKPYILSFHDALALCENDYSTLIDKYRQGKEIKDNMPGIVPSGVFDGGFAHKDLVRLNGFASFDIDEITKTEALELKARLRDVPWIYYLAHSLGGTNLWGMVRFDDPALYACHYAALIREMSKLGVTLDESGANTNRFRYISYDLEDYMNEDATVFTEFIIGELPNEGAAGQMFDHSNLHPYDRAIIYDFNRRNLCETFLEDAGWTPTTTHGNQIRYIRPGGSKSTSGNIKDNRFYCFTESTILEPRKLYDPFDLFRYFYHDGSVSNAIHDIKNNPLHGRYYLKQRRFNWGIRTKKTPAYRR